MVPVYVTPLRDLRQISRTCIEVRLRNAVRKRPPARRTSELTKTVRNGHNAFEFSSRLCLEVEWGVARNRIVCATSVCHHIKCRFYVRDESTHTVGVDCRYFTYNVYCVREIRGYPFRGFKSIGLELDICQTKLLNQFFSFQLKV